ncbi:glycosyltransferase [Belnapia sp. T6]|uniref:Glycosyltransferase n=1 Tax=Belnapia mucosa TaxID=2804532 RepID=A0ABS1VAV7_9PROT|nr:glycosyltransferase [Belnapia mucosa]MBL6458807.1 glycosyltransferase [Belnapia mucosa]
MPSDQVVAVDPAVRGAMLSEGLWLVKSGRYKDAVHLLESLAQGGDGSCDLTAALARAYEGLGEKHRARLLWLRLTHEEEGRQHKPLLFLGRNALERRAYSDAVSLLTTHLEHHPNDVRAAERLLEARLAAASPGEHLALCEEHMRRWPPSCTTLTLQAVHVARQDSYKAAQGVLRQAEELWDGQSASARRIARTMESLGLTEDALHFIERVKQKLPDDAGLIQMEMRLLRSAAAPRARIIEAAQAVVALNPENADSHAALGDVYAGFRDWAKAATCYEAAMRLAPRTVAHWTSAIRAYGQLERDDSIAALLEEAARSFRRRGADGILDLAMIEIAARRFTEAVGRVTVDMSNPRIRPQARNIAALGLASAGDYFRGWNHLSAALTDGTASDELRRLAVRASLSMRLVEPGAKMPVFPNVLFERAILRPPSRPLIQPAEAVMLVTSSLGAGGAERQVALSARLLAEHRTARGLGRTVLVGQDLAEERGRSVMRTVAETEGLEIEDLYPIDYSELFRGIVAAEPAMREVMRLVAAFPERLHRDILKLYDCFRRHRPQVAHLWQDGVITTGSVAAVLAGVPRIVTSLRNVVAGENDRRRYRPYLAAMYQALAQRSDVMFTANSIAGARDYEKMLGIPTGTIQVIYNGLDAANIQRRGGPAGRARIRAQLGLDENQLLLGGTFRLAPAKRPHLWLDVAERVAASLPQSRFVIVGDGVLRAELQARIDARGLAGRITLAGRQSPVEPWIAAMDTMLLASEVEGLPNVLLEAQALGVPVVATDAGGSGEAMDQGRTGLLVPDDTPDGLAAAVLQLFVDDELRGKARAAAPAFVERVFGLQRMLQNTLQAYDGQRVSEAA